MAHQVHEADITLSHDVYLFILPYFNREFEGESNIISSSWQMIPFALVDVFFFFL